MEVSEAMTDTFFGYGEFVLVPVGLAWLALWAWAVWHIREFWTGEFWSRPKARKVVRAAEFTGIRWAKVVKSVYPLGMGFSFVGPLFLLGGTWVELTTGEPASGGSSLHPLMAVAGALLLTFVVFLVPLALFNRPRSLVPPYMREFRGLFGDWLIEIRNRGRHTR